MAAPVTQMSVPELLHRVQRALLISQKRLAELMGCSSRTIIRYYQRGGYILPEQYARLANACQPYDAALAAYLAAHAGMSVEQLASGPKPVRLAATAPGLPAPQGAAGSPAAPSLGHLADSVVCAAAEAMQVSPHVMRPALVAGLERMFAVGMSAADLLGSMKDRTGRESGAAAKAGQRGGGAADK